MTDIMHEVRRHFSQTMGLGPEATGRILAKVRETLARDLTALETVLRGGETEALPPRLHKLKGDLSNIGLAELAARVHGLQVEGLGGPELMARLEGLRRELSPLLEP